MCGHVGIAGKLLTKDENTMKRLLMLDYFRGPDSTGFAAIRSSNDEVKLCKISSHPLDLFEMTGFKQALNGNASTVFLGHNRAATKGKVNTFNAHPFQFGHIVGAHNGTLSVGTHKKLEKKLGQDYEVDSMAVFACIEKFGIEETVAEFHKSTDGVSCVDAWALVWYDLQDKSLNFLRNKERPMWYSYSKEFDRVIWASEWPMIQAAVELSAPGYELYKTEPNDKGHSFQYFRMDEDIHYRFDIDALKKGATTRPKTMAKKIEGKGTYPVSVNKGTYDPFQRNGEISTGTHFHGTTTSKTGHSSTAAAEKEISENNKILHIFAERTDPYGGVITPERFLDLAKYGCSWCQASIDYNEVGCTVIDRDDIILCPSCSSAAPGSNRVYMKNIAAAGE